jgi:hypothetical protein
LLGLCATAEAQETAMRGIGTRSCGEFAKHYRRSPASADLIFNSWAQGFWSGLNGQLLVDGKPIRNLAGSFDTMAAGLRFACDQRPLATFMTIALDYFMSLPELPNPGVGKVPGVR